MDRLDAFKTIAAQASRGELTFPANVNAALRLQQALNDPDCHIEQAARLIQADPLLAARSVAIANSVAYNRSGTEISSVRAAVQRLGIRTLQSLVAAVIVRQIGSEVTEPSLAAKINQLWEHTAHVAALAQVIARRVTHVDPDTALFAGIMHEVAGFYMLASAGEFPRVMDGEPEDWVEHGELEIGRGVMTHLGVPEAVFKAIESMWVGLRALPPETLGDTLLLANDLAPVHSPLHQRPGATTLQGARTIDFVVGDGTLHAIMTESALEVQSLYAVLML
ncbi:HD-like signal output (HDOD) domain, no enzymatic activity [Duganella sp. CF402]|uniref:HDOD domain-containing protein n=1 Tax=unclassified Duganella TaxID=2636909 RepID=UPI0008C12535|nr:MULTISPECIES: HDOD domain-containing protein [unclassified Duganella]RZT08019.1 HD-like signal output (HDOD) protein [Duganella sp. BK701]SEM08391.1 HD-like signal output (HDOD) domain, no enzymatic activity [Duganella sp. CF402]